MDEKAKERLLLAGAAAWAQTFHRAAPADQSTLEAELEDAPDDVRTSVTSALWSHSYDDFCQAVRRQLLKPV